MDISVIIPTYNRANFIKRALQSVQNQSFQAKEIIIIDDGSNDNTKEILKDENITYIYQENAGVSKARNLGISLAKSPWIAFLDSDDVWEKDKLQEHNFLHVKNPKLLASFSDERWVRNNKEIKLKAHQQKEAPTFLNSLALCKIGTSTFFAHHSIFKDIGTFDESLIACEDYDLWLRILLKYEIAYIDKKLSTKYAGHENQLSFNTPLIDTYRIQALEKHLNCKYKKAIKDEILSKISILKKGAIKRDNKNMIDYCNAKLASL